VLTYRLKGSMLQNDGGIKKPAMVTVAREPDARKNPLAQNQVA
jgi:hypothetical protein